MKNLFILAVIALGGHCAAFSQTTDENQKRFSQLPEAKIKQVLDWIADHPQGQLANIATQAQQKKPPVSTRKMAVEARHGSNKHKHHSHCVECNKKYHIREAHFRKHGVVITKPGHYCLTENVVYKAHKDHSPAITIRANDVILDLSDHVLEQSTDSFSRYDDTSGIVVEPGYNNITIKDGRIRNFSNMGVLVASNATSLDEIDHNDIVIKDIIVNDCGKITTTPDIQPFFARSGIAVYGSRDCLIEDCEVSGITSFNDSEAFATFFTDTLTIKNCYSHHNFANLDSDTGFVEGFQINFFSNTIITGCTAVHNNGAQSVGIVPLFGESLVLEDSQANDNIAPFPTVDRAFAGGIVVVFVDSAVVTNCQANHNVAQSELLGISGRKFATGIQIALSNADVSNCSANFNLATSHTGLSQGGCVGFDINTVTATTLKNCSATGNSNFSTDASVGAANGIFGFDCDNASNVLFEDCVAIANNPQEGGTPVKVGGFYASIFPEGGPFSNIVYRNCYSFNHASAFEDATVTGFLIGEAPPTNAPSMPTQIILDGCIAESNFNSETPANSAGIIFEDFTTGSTIVNCILKGNGVGILLRGDDTVSNLIENNEVTANLVYGIQDTTSNLNSYAKNYAYNPDAVANYTGLPAFTPVRSWQIGNPPATVDNNGILDPLDNINVFN